MYSITDKDIIDYFVNKEKGILIAARISKNGVNKVPEMKEYLENRYDDKFTKYSEIVTRIYYNIDKIPTCKVCGKKLKYKTFKTPYGSEKWCSCKCQLKDKDFISWRSDILDYNSIREKSRKTLEEKYGNANYRNLEKARKTLMERYGTDCALTGSIREKTKEKLYNLYGKYSTTNVDKIKQTKLERYGNEYYTNQEKARKTFKEKYDVEYTLQSKELYDKVRKTKQEKYGDSTYSNNEKAKNTVKGRYGVDNVFQLKSVRDLIDYKKIVETKRKNHTLNSSNNEDRIEILLKEKFGEENVIREYRDERYCNPENGYKYNCDFYIKSYDLFIELQGHYTHGKHPFDDNNEDDIKLKNYYESFGEDKPSYSKIIEVWCNRDVIKRNVAKTNKLNYIEIFGSHNSSDKINKIIDEYISKIKLR